MLPLFVMRLSKLMTVKLWSFQTNIISAHIPREGVLCLRCILRLWRNDHISRKQCKGESDLVLNGQIRVPK